MGKQLFRFMRSELNGFYISNLYNCLNRAFMDLKSALIWFKNSTLVRSSADTTHPLNEKAISDIAVIAGIFNPFVTTQNNYVMILLCESYKVLGREYSERGFIDTQKGLFHYRRTDDIDPTETVESKYEDDINSLANNIRRTTLVEEGAEIVGYIAAGIQALDTDNTIIQKAISVEPPEDNAYSAYYGDKYAYLLEPVELTSGEGAFTKKYYAYVKWALYTKRYGVTLKMIAFSLRDICGLSVQLSEILMLDNGTISVIYSLVEEALVDNTISNIFTWQALLRQFDETISFEQEITELAGD